MLSRRNFFGAAAAVSAASVSRVALAALPEPTLQSSADTQPPLVPSTGRPYNPVVTLNGWTLPWRMNQGVKEFHLVAEPVLRELAPGMTARLWATTVNRRARRSRWWRATACASSSPTAFPNTPACTGTANACPMAWTASRA